MTVTLDLNPELEQGLLDQAQENGVSVDDSLRELVRKQVHGATSQAVPKAKFLRLPAVPLGLMGSLHRRDIYDDVP